MSDLSHLASLSEHEERLRESWKEFCGRSNPSSLVCRKITGGIDEVLRERCAEVGSALGSRNGARFMVPEGGSEAFLRQWAAGRRAWMEILNDLGEMAGSEDLKLSLTHSGDWVLAAGVIDGAGAGIGVDLEPASRSLSGRLQKRAILDTEPREELEPIDFWVIKEASFKAISPPSGVVWKFQVEGVDPEVLEGDCRSPWGRTHFRLNPVGDWVVAFARA